MPSQITIENMMTLTTYKCDTGQDTSESYFYFNDEQNTTVHAHAYHGYHFLGWQIEGQPDYIYDGKVKAETTFVAVFGRFDATV